MDGVVEDLLKSAAAQLSGTRRRQFLAQVGLELCGGNARQAEKRFGWGRETIAEGLAQTLEISVDTKAKVKLGEYSQGGKS